MTSPCLRLLALSPVLLGFFACYGEVGPGGADTNEAGVAGDGFEGADAGPEGMDATDPDATDPDARGFDAPTAQDAPRPVDAPTPADAATPPDAASPAPDGPAPCTTLTIYMSPTGVDSRTGLSASQAVRTLTRVQEILQADGRACPAVVKVGLGTYYGQSVTWTYLRGADVTFEPADGYAAQVRPVFDGCSSLTGACTRRTWFAVTARGATRLQFRYLRVQRYSTAISFNGDRDHEAQRISDNLVYGMYFDRIGNGWTGAESHDYSTAAVRLVNGDDNVIANSHFYAVTNRPDTSPGALHALYIAHSSDRNSIRGNVFENVSGDAIRVRDYGYANVIEDNRISRAGSYGYSEWYCDAAHRTDCTKPDECWSWENVFRNNTLDGTYACAPMGTWTYWVPEAAEACTRPARGDVRLHTSGNTQTATPCSL